MHFARNSIPWAIVTVLCLGCATTPSTPTPGTGTVYGDLRLVPREGVKISSGDGGAYSDRRMRDVEMVDYKRPGFAVVWLDGGARAGERAQISIRVSSFETRLEPRWTAIAVGGVLRFANTTSETHTVSCPSLGLLKKLGPGESVELPVPEEGAHPYFLLERRDSEGGVFAAPGPYAVLSETGRFELRDVAPGPARLHAFHPRFPPLARPVDVPADGSLKVDLEMGVGRSEGGSR